MELGRPYAALVDIGISYAALVDIGISYAALADIGISYAALVDTGISYTALVDVEILKVGTLSVTLSLFVFFLKYTNTAIMTVAAVMSTSSIPAAPAPAISGILLTVAPVLCGGGVVKGATEGMKCVTTGSEGRGVGLEL